MKRATLSAAFALLLSAVTPTAADEFYNGRRVTLIVGNGAGTAYDASARLVARHLGQNIPGTPTIVIQNMPGATGLTAANYVSNIAAQDGSVIANAHQSLPLRQLLGDKAVQYDAAGFKWLGSPEVSNQTLALWHTSPVRTMEDAMKHEVVMGGTTPRADTVIVLALANNLVGTRFKVVLGYQANQIDIAMERGEVAGRAVIWGGMKATKPDWIRDNKVRIICQLGLRREPELPDVPLLHELVKDPDDKRVIELFSAQLALGRPFYAPAKVPADRVAVLRKAFAETMRATAFLEDAKRSGHEVQPVTGADLQAIVKTMMSTPSGLIDRANKAQVLVR